MNGRRARLALHCVVVAACWASLAACDRPCATLADRLCEAAGSDDHACEAWRERVGRVPASTCIAGLKALDRERVR